MPAALDLLNAGIGLIARSFGTEFVQIDGEPAPVEVNWNDLGRTEEVELAGRRVRFSCTIEATRAQFANPPKQGQRVTRISDGSLFRIVGPINTDALTHRMALDSVNR